MEHTSNQYPGTEQRNASCPNGLCSIGLMKSFCPSCMLIGLVILPFELLVRLVRRIFTGAAGRGFPARAEQGAYPPSRRGF